MEIPVFRPDIQPNHAVQLGSELYSAHSHLQIDTFIDPQREIQGHSSFKGITQSIHIQHKQDYKN